MKNLICLLLAAMIISCGDKSSSDEKPTVITSAVTNVTGYSATSGGNILTEGSSPVSARGVCWDTAASPKVSGLHTSDLFGIGSYTSQITGLSPNTTYHVRAYATNEAGTDYGDEVGLVTTSVNPMVTTTAITGITVNSAVGGGNVMSDSGSAVTARGICWNTAQNPTLSNSHTNDGTGTGGFSSLLTGLLFHRTYYVRAYATNSAGTRYGSQVSFMTAAGLPVVTTSSISGITSNSASGGGNVTADSGATVTARGICWSTSENPTDADSKTTNGTGTGSFTSSITGLSPLTTYYVRAYAANSLGTVYGSQVNFTTNAIGPPTVSTASISNITTTTASGGGNVTADGGATVTARGICWSTSQNPTITDLHTSDGTGTGSFTSSIGSLSPSTTYYVKAYATNSMGTAYGGQVSLATNALPITDIDGNVYHSVTIGTQVWMVENLKTTKYRNGTDIPYITDNALWSSDTTGAYCNYQNIASNSTTYGRLYNWYAVNNVNNIAPTGWHVASDAEWTILTDFLGGEAVAGGKLKEAGTAHWNSPNTGATNESGFTALPGGWRRDYGPFEDGSWGYWWSATEYNATIAWNRLMVFSAANVWRNDSFKTYGFHVRCIKD